MVMVALPTTKQFIKRGRGKLFGLLSVSLFFVGAKSVDGDNNVPLLSAQVETLPRACVTGAAFVNLYC